MLTIELKMVIIFCICNPNLKHVFLASVLGATPPHIPLTYRCSIKIGYQIRYVYLMQTIWSRMNKAGVPTFLTHYGHLESRV
jgi:hypothetical protein